MATIRLVPSAYTRSSTTRVTVTDDANMYNNTDHTANYATLRGRNSSSSTYYCFIHGFNFSQVPDNATVSSFSVKIRCYRSSNQRTGTNYNLRLASSPSSNSVISDTTASDAIGITDSVITIPTGNLTWNTLKNYGTNFSIDVVLASNSSSYPYVYVYGAEIEVTYTIPTTYNVTASTTTGTISPSGTTQVIEGHSYTLTISATSPHVTDNNVDVTSQLVRVTGGAETLIPNGYTNTGFSVTNISNAYTAADSNTSATLTLAGRTTGNLYLLLGGINIPSSATIQSVSASATLQFSRGGSSSSFTSSCQMYSGSTAKGSSTTVVSSATDLAKTTFTLTPGTWTASDLADVRFYLTAYNGASSTQRTMQVYGVTFSVTYTVSGEVYTYTITNVQADHTIVVSAGTVTSKIYFKNGSSWVGATKVYKKVNGSWVEQTTLTNVFDNNTNYLKG